MAESTHQKGQQHQGDAGFNKHERALCGVRSQHMALAVHMLKHDPITADLETRPHD
ncbi:hypothetical protein SCFA_1140017 [anaerobic digester metagenome]|uniref:Uncharacterized protein n=1 Tax=anaerobic digester metagenome TaxID=1263854 RepID=A0A485LUR3_9ZZZZ